MPAVGMPEGVSIEPGGVRASASSQSVLTAVGSPNLIVELAPLPARRPRRHPLACVTSNGAPDCAWKMPDTSQLPSTQRSGAADDSSVGKR